MRAYIFAVAASQMNDTVVSSSIFLSACGRFALESPTPTLTHKLALYGNPHDVMKTLEDAIEKLGDKVTWDPKQHVANNMGLKIIDKGAEFSKSTVARELEVDTASDQEI